MGLASMKIFAVLQLSLVLLSSVNAGKPLTKAHPPMPHGPQPIHHSTPPSHAPAPAPSRYHHHHHHLPPPPAHSPSPAPSRKAVAVEGVVYCKSCKYSGHETLTGASSLSGAVVKLECYNSKRVKTKEAKTDKNGYFFLDAAKTVSTYGAHKCKVYLVSSPKPLCSVKTNLNCGITGDSLTYEKNQTAHSYVLYKVGPFAFEPPKCKN